MSAAAAMLPVTSALPRPRENLVIVSDQLELALSRLDVRLGWPRRERLWWAQLAQALYGGSPLPAQPAAFDCALLRRIHSEDADTARAVMRLAGGWLEAPHDDADFFWVLGMWERGHEPDAGDAGEDHFVAARSGAFGLGSDEVSVARCKDCGLPVYSIGLEFRLSQDEVAESGWRRIWPSAGAFDPIDTSGPAR